MKRLKEYQAPLTDCWGRVVFEANFMASQDHDQDVSSMENLGGGFYDDWD